MHSTKKQQCRCDCNCSIMLCRNTHTGNMHTCTLGQTPAHIKCMAIYLFSCCSVPRWLVTLLAVSAVATCVICGVAGAPGGQRERRATYPGTVKTSHQRRFLGKYMHSSDVLTTPYPFSTLLVLSETSQLTVV